MRYRRLELLAGIRTPNCYSIIMDKETIQRLFSEYLNTYDEAQHRQVWFEYSKIFQEFWKSKIMAYGKIPIPEADYDQIIKMIDAKARGFNSKTDEAIAIVGLRQGTWYRIFNDLKEKESIRTTLDKIFKSDDELELIALIDRLQKENADNKNGLTGKSANALDALLFINKPDNFISCVSLSHRIQIMESFGFDLAKDFSSYGEQVIGSNQRIIDGFREKFGIGAWPRTISTFLYAVSQIKSSWYKAEIVPGETVLPSEEQDTENESEFVLEKHLEDFLVGNWESTELGKNYELFEDEGGTSQQYPTEGRDRIDILVKDKKDGSFVVIELKKGQTNDDTVGQLARYMGWVKKHKANGKKVNGIIIARSNDPRLRNALEVVPNTKLLLYRVNFSLIQPIDQG